MEFDVYEVLGVDEKATAKEIKKAYQKAAMKWHPDRNLEDKENATEKFQEVIQSVDGFNTRSLANSRVAAPGPRDSE